VLTGIRHFYNDFSRDTDFMNLPLSAADSHAEI
jgi:hypothetical protein